MRSTPVRPTVGLGSRIEPLNPKPWLYVGLVLTAVGWVETTFIAPYYEPLKFTASQSSNAATLAALFLGAIIYVHIYDYVNSRAEERQLRQDYALSRVKDIYVPLWEEAAALIESAARYEWAELRWGDAQRQELWKQGFENIMKGPLRLFIDVRLRGLLSSFHATMPAYNDAWSAARNDLYYQARAAASELTGQPEDANLISEFGDLLTTNSGLVWGATDERGTGTQVFRERFRQAYSRIPAARPDTMHMADVRLGELLTRLRSRPSAEAMRRASQTSVAAGGLAIKRLEEIVRDPTRAVLDFATS